MTESGADDSVTDLRVSRTGDRGGSALGLERACAVLCLALSAYVGLGAESLVSESSMERPGVFPPHGALWVAAGVLGISSAVWVVQAFRRRAATYVADLGRPRDVMIVLAVLVVGAWSVRWLGLLPAAAATYLVLMVFYRDRGLIFVVGSLVAYVLVLHYGLEVLLGVPLPRSPILPLPF